MKSADIAIGITTYDNISIRDTGLAVYDTLHRCDQRLTPEFINWHEPVDIPIVSRETWPHYGATDAVMRGRPALDIKMGAIWRRRKSLANWGMVHHASGNDGDLDWTLILRFNQKAALIGLVYFSIFAQCCDLLLPYCISFHRKK